MINQTTAAVLFMFSGSLETRPRGKEKRPGEYCLCAESALPEKVVIAHFSILSVVLHRKILIMPVYVHFDPDVQFEYYVSSI